MKVLIVKSSALGDVVQAFPCLSWLKKKFPAVSIDWVVESACQSIVSAHPDIDRTLVVDTRRWRKRCFSKETRREIAAFYRSLRACEYDVVFDLQGNTKSALCTAMAKAKVKVGFGWRNVSEWPNLLATQRKYLVPLGGNVCAEYLHLLQSYFVDFSFLELECVVLNGASDEAIPEEYIQGLVRKCKAPACALVMVCPGSNWRNKQLSSAALHGFLTLMQAHLSCRFLFIWGTPAEQLYVDRLQMHFPTSVVVERLPLPVLQNLMGEMDLVISVDSLPLHLAATTKTPTFSFFGPSAAAKYKPSGAQHGYIQGACPYGQRFERRCPLLRTCATGACLRNLTGEQIFSSFLDWHQGGGLSHKR